MKTVGVDIAGAKNTWMALIDLDSQSNEFDEEYPKMQTLEEIVVYCLDPKNDVKNIVIDAPLSYAIDEENGMRDCELLLREALFAMDINASMWLQAIHCKGWPFEDTVLLKSSGNADLTGTFLKLSPATAWPNSLPHLVTAS